MGEQVRVTASNPDERIRARVVARKLADELVDSFLTECVEEANKHPEWKVEFTEAFFDQLRETINTINPPKDKQAPVVVTRQQRLPMTSPMLIDEKLRYMCNIDGHCVRSSGKAVLIKTGDGTTFWVPIRCLEDPDDPPSAGEIIDRMEVPGFKIIEAQLEHLVD